MERNSGYSVLLRNLRYSTTPQAVREAFEPFGRIRDVYLPLDYNTRRPRGFGFVEYYEKADALEAVKVMDNGDLDGNFITCCLAQDRRKSPNSMRRAYHAVRTPRRNGYHDRRYRSRSRSYHGHEGRRSYSYGRRYPPQRSERGYYDGKYSPDRSPGRYGRDYRAPIRDSRPPREYRAPIRDYRLSIRDSRHSRDTRPHLDYRGPGRDSRPGRDFVERSPREYIDRSPLRARSMSKEMEPSPEFKDGINDIKETDKISMDAQDDGAPERHRRNRRG